MKRKSILIVLVIMGLAVTLSFNDLQKKNVDNNIVTENNNIQNDKLEETTDALMSAETSIDNTELTINNDLISSYADETFNQQIDTEMNRVEEQSGTLVSEE